MKILIVVICAFTFSYASAQEDEPEGYVAAPTLSITGDFDGNGTTDVFRQFVVDSLGNEISRVATSEDVVDYIMYPGARGFSNAFTLNGKATDIDNYYAIGLFCLINLGNINKSKGDEIALVHMLLDESRLNTCRIYSYCNKRWVQVYSFNINEEAFDYEGLESVFNNIPGALEMHKNKWHYYDFTDDDYEKRGHDASMKLLRVHNCR